MHREGQPYRKEIWNAHTAVIDKTQSFLDYEAGQTYKFMCGVGDYGQEGQHKYYANIHRTQKYKYGIVGALIVCAFYRKPLTKFSIFLCAGIGFKRTHE